MKLLLIEDDEDIAGVIKRGLEAAHYSVDLEFAGDTGLARACNAQYDLIILDIMLPARDGWEICSELRQNKITTPILMLTAMDTVPDRVRGLELGADDYLVKPFEFKELVARVAAVLRRDKVHKTRLIQIADLEIDTRTRSVVRSGKEIPLTPREYALLEGLALRAGQVLTRDVIQENIWMEDQSFSNTVDVRVAQLRKKIDTGHDIKLIHTVHKRGYTLRVLEEA